MEIELRRNQNTLVVIGQGVIAFGAYMVVRAILQLLLDPASFISGVAEEYLWVEYIMIAFFFVVIIGGDMLLRVYIGRRAIRDGKGRRAGTRYIVFAGLLALADIAVVIMDLTSMESYTGGLLEFAVTLIADITMGVTTVELVLAALRVRKLRQQLAEGG